MDNSFAKKPEFDGSQFLKAYQKGWHDFKNLNLQDIDLNLIFILKVDFSHSQMCRANLERSRMQDVVGHNTNLEGSNLRAALLSRVDLNSANLSGTDLRLVYADDCQFKGANLSHCLLRRSKWIGSNFSNAKFCGADLSLVNFTNSNLNGADLRGAQITQESILEGALYSQETLFSEGFDPVKWGMILTDQFASNSVLKNDVTLPELHASNPSSSITMSYRGSTISQPSSMQSTYCSNSANAVDGEKPQQLEQHQSTPSLPAKPRMYRGVPYSS